MTINVTSQPHNLEYVGSNTSTSGSNISLLLQDECTQVAGMISVTSLAARLI